MGWASAGGGPGSPHCPQPSWERAPGWLHGGPGGDELGGCRHRRGGALEPAQERLGGCRWESEKVSERVSTPPAHTHAEVMFSHSVPQLGSGSPGNSSGNGLGVVAPSAEREASLHRVIGGLWGLAYSAHRLGWDGWVGVSHRCGCRKQQQKGPGDPDGTPGLVWNKAPF